MTDATPSPSTHTIGTIELRAFLVELLHFTHKEARACLFTGLFFLSVFLVPRAGLLGVPHCPSGVPGRCWYG